MYDMFLRLDECVNVVKYMYAEIGMDLNVKL